MPRRWRSEQFDPDGRFTVARPIRWSMPDGSAREFVVGEEFPPTELRCSPRRLQVLHRGGYVRCEVKGQRDGGVIKDRGKGWFQVIVPGKVPRRVRGEDAAEQALAEMTGRIPATAGF